MRFNQITDFVDAYILQIVAVITAATKSAIFLLFFSQIQKPLFNKWNQRKCPQAGLRFCRVSRDKYALAVNVTGCYRMANRERVILEVNGLPFQSDNLTAA